MTNIFLEQGVPLDKQRFTWRDLVQKPISKLDGDTYTGRGEGLFCNAAGGQCVSLGCAQTVGQRLKVESPSCQ